jgi:hypothetical protein
MNYSEDTVYQNWSLGPYKIKFTGDFKKDSELLNQQNIQFLKQRLQKIDPVCDYERRKIENLEKVIKNKK